MASLITRARQIATGRESTSLICVEREKCLVRLFLFVIRLHDDWETRGVQFSSHLPEAPIVPVSGWEPVGQSPHDCEQLMFGSTFASVVLSRVYGGVSYMSIAVKQSSIHFLRFLQLIYILYGVLLNSSPGMVSAIGDYVVGLSLRNSIYSSRLIPSLRGKKCLGCLCLIRREGHI